MTLDDVRSIALQQTAATEDIKWNEHLCFSVAGKMFLITSPDRIPQTAAFKMPEDEFYEILNREGFTKHAYIGRYHWVHLDDIARLTKQEWKHYIHQSYMLVASRLPKKVKRELKLL